MAGLLTLCLPAAQAQIASDAAQIASMMGRVSVERGGELWTVSNGQAIEAGQIIVTGADGSAQLLLPDASSVEIFPNSRLIYRANRFNWRDLLDLYLGKVRLQIQQILPGETPLRVTSPTAVISVRGTVFEVEVDAAQDTTIWVDTGAVSVRHRLIPGQEVMVQSGQSLRVASTLPLTAAAKSAVPLRTLGRVVRAVGDTLAQIKAARGSSGGSGASGGSTASSSGGGVSGSDSGSNETKPPAGEDDTGSSSNSGNSGGGPTAPPGDVLP
ncbi:MAG: FecR domain-containing protein [Acidobacteria bacterium]|nr:FecR domain-containing protein [Acidobacteriota bacterium]